MAVPKRKMSRSNTRNRRSQWKAKLTELTTIPAQGRARAPFYHVPILNLYLRKMFW